MLSKFQIMQGEELTNYDFKKSSTINGMQTLRLDEN
jgi:hypothetical protein